MVVADLSHRLRDAFLAARYDTDGVVQLLGAPAHAALGRGEPEPARIASDAAGPLGTLVGLFLLGDPQPAAAVAEALRPLSVPDALAAGVLRETPEGLRAGLDIRPHGDEQGSWWVVSDLDADALGRPVAADHVLGVGHASLSLARATTRRPVRSLLDLGTGCGVQALHASRHAERITATDVSRRALRLARLTFELNKLDVDLREGPWLGPVDGERFDQIVCNPPFVVGPPEVDVVYRDSGLAGDSASELLVRALPAALNDGGVAHLLASWLHVRGADWADRVAAWLPPGVDGWFVQRDVADPTLYVGTWLRDTGIDPATPAGRRKTARWLEWFAAGDIDAVGYGFVTLRRVDGRGGDVVCEDLRHAYDDPLGAESAGWLDRVCWLRDRDNAALLAQRFVVPPSVVLERVCAPTEDGWSPTTGRLHRTDGPGWRHDVDDLGAALLAGCRGAMPVGDLLALLAMAHDVPTDELVARSLPAVRNLIRHGMLLPAEWAEAHGGARCGR